MNIQRNKWTYLSGLALISLGALASQVRGVGIPASDALTYSGTLEDESGALLNGPRNIEVKLWLADASDPLCATGSERREVSNGRFRVPLPDKCTKAISDNPDIFVEDVPASSSSLQVQAGTALHHGRGLSRASRWRRMVRVGLSRRPHRQR